MVRSRSGTGDEDDNNDDDASLSDFFFLHEPGRFFIYTNEDDKNVIHKVVETVRESKTGIFPTETWEVTS